MKLNTKEFKTEVKKIFDSINKIHSIKIIESSKYEVKSIFLIYGLYGVQTVELKVCKRRKENIYQIYNINGKIDLYLVEELNELLKNL